METNEFSHFVGLHSSLSSSSSEKQLSCGGHPCSKCGACCDWYQRRDNDEVVKRRDANCNLKYMHCHDLVRHPDRSIYCYYPAHNLICMCNDNH